MIGHPLFETRGQFAASDTPCVLQVHTRTCRAYIRHKASNIVTAREDYGGGRTLRK